jgi:hypothetical protein
VRQVSGQDTAVSDLLEESAMINWTARQYEERIYPIVALAFIGGMFAGALLLTVFVDMGR